jgi:predicted nucleic acid-binding protein
MLAWKGHSDESLRQTTDLISLLPELPMSEAVIEQAIRIRKTFGLKLPDAVIAATALAHGLQLMTANESDFKRVLGLDLYCI